MREVLFVFVSALGACSSGMELGRSNAGHAERSLARARQATAETLDERWAPAADREFEAHERAIDAELARDGGPSWAGEFRLGEDAGNDVTLKLARAAGFVVRSRGSASGVRDRNQGSVRDVDGVLEFDFAWSNERDGRPAFPTKLVPVRWGEREYLLAQDRLAAFCNHVNHGWEPREHAKGGFLLRVGDEVRAASGKPPLGERYAKLLLNAPLEALVCHTERFEICVNEDGQEVITRVTIGQGWRDGVVEGLEFFVSDGGTGSWMTIEDTSEHTARGILARHGNDVPLPPIGARATTRL